MNNILILGSKPPGKIPKISAECIFSSNGSAELAKIYIDRFKKTKHVCIIGAKSFSKLDDIKKRVVNSLPDEIIIRDYNKIYSYFHTLFEKDVIFKKFTKKEQFLYQKFSFEGGLLDLYFAEFNYEKNFIGKLKHIYNCLVYEGFMGVSSGFFALLYAAQKYPNSNLILSGIGFEGGDHYYKTGEMTMKRGFVDNFLFSKLKKKIKKRIAVLDAETSNKFNIKKIEAEHIEV